MEKKSFHLFFYITMFSSIFSNISQHNTDMLEEQCHEMQRRHEEKQQLQAYLEEAVEVCHVEHATQKMRKMAEAKIRKKAKKQRIIEEEKKKK